DSKRPPAAATILFGANDAAILGRTSEQQHVPVEKYEDNLRKIVLHLKVQHVPFAHLSSLPQSLVLSETITATISS
ncbi:PREDICTED: GDSL esterase/lipase, partial [Prunus dulcis]